MSEETKKYVQEIIQSFSTAESGKRDHFLVKSCIPERFRTETFESYAKYNADQLSSYVYKSRIKALAFVKKYCDEMRNSTSSINKKSILLMGQSGSGKSSLGALVLRSYIQIAAKEVLYVQYSSFKSQCLTIHLDPEIKAFKETYVEPDYLMIDEINEDTYNAKVSSFLEDVLRMRTDAQKNTILATKMELIDFKRYFKDNVYGHITNPNYFNEKIEIATEEKKYDLGADFMEFINLHNPEFDGEFLTKKLNEIAKRKNAISSSTMLKILKESMITKKNKTWSV